MSLHAPRRHDEVGGRDKKASGMTGEDLIRYITRQLERDYVLRLEFYKSGVDDRGRSIYRVQPAEGPRNGS